VGGGRFPDASNFPQQVWELAALLDGEHRPVRLQPEVATVPQVWLLGSSDFSGALAAELGLPFAFAHFINPRGGDAVSRAYRDTFKATEKRPKPQVIVCTFAIVGETDDEAERLAQSIDLRRLHMALNIDSPVPTPEEAARHRYSDEERRYVTGQRARAVIGGPEKAKQEINLLAEKYQADEVMVLTITGDYESRRRSYELLIGAFQ
jgi:luciferase family oxidoreductase group 1